MDSAEINLSKNLTLFCGPNGTGKTYVAYLLNALLNLKAKFPVEPEMIEYFRNNHAIEIKPSTLRLWADHVGSRLKSILPSVFGLSSKEGLRMFQSTEINLFIGDDDFNILVDSEVRYFYFHNFRPDLRVLRLRKAKGERSISVGDLENVDDDASAWEIISEVCSFIFKSILLSRYPSRMLTVERNSIYTFKTELLANRIETVDNVLISDSEDAGEIVRKRTTLYPQAVRNSLLVANELPEIIKKDTEYTDFASEIESQLLSGTVTIGKEGDVQFEPSSAPGHDSLPLPIQMSSSSVKTLSGLVIYLRHLAKKGDVLIIDEPEMNLHPDNQRRLARIFARMINNGLRLVISTHSDYIIRELNNLIMLKALALLSRDTVVESEYSPDEAIDKTAVQAFLFNFNETMRVKATPIPVDDYGLEVKTIDVTIQSQNEQTIILRDSLDECVNL